MAQHPGSVLPPHRAADLPPKLKQQLSRRQKLALSSEILAIYCQVRLGLRRLAFPEALSRLRTLPPGVQVAPQTPITYVRAARLAWAVRRTLGVVPTDARCLIQSLVLTRVLAKRGIDSSLVIGVAPGDQFTAHAWVEFCGRSLLPDAEGQYEVLSHL